MTRRAFETIDSHFGLHPSTLPAISVKGGIYSKHLERDAQSGQPPKLRLVVKAAQKVEIANYLLSLTHEFSSGCTSAFLCGDGVVKQRPIDVQYGEQLQQLTSAIVAHPGLWADPLSLPCGLMHNYALRLQTRDRFIRDEVARLEFTLGVTNAGRVWQDTERNDWPNDIDPKNTTILLHSVAKEIVYLRADCKWLQDYADFLYSANQQLRSELSPGRWQKSSDTIAEAIETAFSWIKGIDTGFSILHQRANLQVNVMYNIISQQENLLSQKESRINTSIAKSAKHDSISVTTFTFITASFLPGSFMATVFSMTMFDWRAKSETASPQTVSSNFWIYWAVTIPLTLCTLVGWACWYLNASKKLNTDIEMAHTTHVQRAVKQPTT
jgi:hypothetical protein